MEFKEREKIVGQSTFKGLIGLAWPAVTSTLFYIIFEVIDMFWIGKIGANPVAALSAASFFVWMLRAFALTIATGTIARVSRRVGEKDTASLLTVVTGGIISTVIFTVIILTVFLPIVSKVFSWIRLDPHVITLAAEYTTIFLSGLIFVFLMVTMEHIMRGLGNTRTPMMITGLALVMNTLLDPLFIFTFQMGLAGAAAATIISQCVGAGLMTVAVLKRLPGIKTSKPRLNRKFFKNHFLPLIRIGFPISFSEAAFSVIYLVLAGIISIFGSEPLAAIGIGHRLEVLPYFISTGFARATATMVGQNLGAGQVSKAKKSVYLSIKICTAILVVVCIGFFLFAAPLCRLFINNKTVIQYGVSYLRIISIFEVFMGIELILVGAFSGAGDTKPPFFIIFPITLLRIPLSYLIAVKLQAGIVGIWSVISASTFFKGILLFIWFKRGKWIKKHV